MATTYSIQIDLDDPDTLQFLQGRSLRVYKSVKTSAKGLPTVWFSQDRFADTVTFEWTETYGAYVSDNGVPVPGLVISDRSLQGLDLGQRLIASDSGATSTDNKGVSGGLTVHNTGERDWTCGMGQMIEGSLSPICAFDLGGMGESIIMEPYERVLLVFDSSQQIDTGSVVATAISASCTVELDGQNTSRTVRFRKSTGWSSNTEGWVTLNDSDLDLAPALIVPGSV